MCAYICINLSFIQDMVIVLYCIRGGSVSFQRALSANNLKEGKGRKKNPPKRETHGGLRGVPAGVGDKRKERTLLRLWTVVFITAVCVQCKQPFTR